MVVLKAETWQLKAACQGPQAPLFFPPTTFERKEEKEDREADAKHICSGCSVRRDCLDYAIRIREPHGIWGGTTEIERRALLGRQAS